MEARSLAAAFMRHDTTGEIAAKLGRGYLVLPNVGVKRATAVWGQARELDDKQHRLAGLAPCRWRSA